ncbi:MAG: CDP-alcohol phosphatidyltransferase family protein, partial [Myxococcota bacterium]
MASSGSTKNSPARLTLAWGVHLLTASGAVVGMVSIMAILAGDLTRAALLMMLALAIDSIDGTLARKARVKQLLPRV